MGDVMGENEEQGNAGELQLIRNIFYKWFVKRYSRCREGSCSIKIVPFLSS